MVVLAMNVGCDRTSDRHEFRAGHDFQEEAPRLERSKELWGPDTFTTRDYNEILARKDIDAVIIGTPDHWHRQASVDAMKAGKDVYCEKPMIHEYKDGPEMIETAKTTNRIIQIGSQRVSSILYAKAKELLASGAIGKPLRSPASP